ncbi:MAG TPA: dihydrodipicolinate synthase family protein [Granulicella sp.]
MLLEGLHIPLTTPFFADGRLNLRKLEQNVQHYSLTPAAGMIVLGENGEPPLLSETETVDALKTALAAAADAKVMLAGVARNSLRSILELMEEAARIGYDAVALAPPALPGLTPDELRTLLQMAADRSPLPVVLTGNLPSDLVCALALHPQIIGYLGAIGAAEIRSLRERTAVVQRKIVVTHVFAPVTGRMAARSTGLVSPESLSGGVVVAAPPARPALRTREKMVSFQILTARSESLMDALEAGAVGVAPPLAAAAPQACYEVYAAWKDGDLPLSAEKQLRLEGSIQLIEEELGVRGVKYGCDRNGYYGGAPRLPLLPLTGPQRAAVEQALLNLRG